MKNPLLLEIPETLHTERLFLRLPRAGFGPQMFESIGASLPQLKPWQAWAQNSPGLEECELECRSEIARIAARTAVIYHLFALEAEDERQRLEAEDEHQRLEAEDEHQRLEAEDEHQRLENAIFVGEIGFSVIDWQTRKFELRFWLDSRFTGRGLMTEAVQSLTEFAFESLDAKRVFMLMDSRNGAARRVAQKCRFALEATLENSVLDAADSSVWVDECMFARVS